MFALKKFLHGLSIAITRIVFRLFPDRSPVTFLGPDSVQELCGSIAQMQVRKVLVVSDTLLVKLGLVERVTRSLQAAGLEWSVYGEVEPDPTLSQVSAGLSQLEREGCDAVLAVGGGSPMDAAKMIAAMATNGADAAKLKGMLKVKRAPLPFYAIPTTAGTGSEVTIVAVVSDPDTHVKSFFIDPKLLPVMAALDPMLMTGLPGPVTAATGMDALTHAVESFLALTARPQTEGYAIAAVQMIFENLPRAYVNGSDLSARKAMALASYLAGLAFTRTGVGYVHAIAHTFGAWYRTPHGLGNAIALPHVLEFSKESAQARLARLADAIGLEGASDEEKARNFIDAVRELMVKVGIPKTLEALKEDDVAPIARQALSEAHTQYPVPRYMSQPQCEGLLRQMLA